MGLFTGIMIDLAQQKGANCRTGVLNCITMFYSIE